MKFTRNFDENFYKALYNQIIDESVDFTPSFDDDKIVQLNFMFRNLNFEVDLDANIELIDDSFAHEFGVERCFHFAVGEINAIKVVNCYDDCREYEIDNNILNEIHHNHQKLVSEHKYNDAYQLTHVKE